MHGWTDDCTNICRRIWLDVWICGWIDGCTDRYGVNEWILNALYPACGLTSMQSEHTQQTCKTGNLPCGDSCKHLANFVITRLTHRRYDPSCAAICKLTQLVNKRGVLLGTVRRYCISQVHCNRVSMNERPRQSASECVAFTYSRCTTTVYWISQAAGNFLRYVNNAEGISMNNNNKSSN